jgi:hypothetical protein
LQKEIVVKHLSALAAGLIALAVASSPAIAVGTSARTFVTAVAGTNDTGTCAISAPCRTFAYALTQTAQNGEIVVLSSGGYGVVTITQSVSIINTSNFAGVTVASGGTGITINAGTNDSVTLRGLTVDGGGTGSNGVVFNSGGELTIDQCDVMNFVGASAATGNGIIIQPASGNHNIVITNTTASNNKYGVHYFPPSGSTATTGIVIDRVNATNNEYGISINGSNSSGTANASISNSIASVNTFDGLYFQNVTASLDASNASSNATDGIQMSSGTTLALGRSVLMNNGFYGLDIDGGSTVNSYKDNRIAGNGAGPVFGTPTAATLY